MLMFLHLDISGQCNFSSTTLYGTATAPTTTCSVVNITACAYWSEYSTVSGLTIGNTYQIIDTWSGDPSDGIGIYTSTTIGTTPLAWVSGTTSPLTINFTATTTTVYIQTFASGCTAPATTCHTRTVACTSCPPPAPNCTTNISPANGATNVSLTPTLTWTAAPGADSYQIWLGTSVATATLLGSVTGTSAVITAAANLQTLTTYYWYIVPENLCAGVSATGCSANAFSFTTGTPPANDNCEGAYVLTVNPAQTCTSVTAGTVNLATQSPQDAAACSGTEDDDVWFKFEATSTSHSIELLNVAGSTTDLFHSVWTGTCPALTLVPNTCSDPNTSTVSGLTIGQIYYIRVYSYTSTTGQTTTFDVCVKTPPAPPANDNCEGAYTVFVNPTLTCLSLTSGTVASATASPQDATACSGTEDDDVWFSFTATGTSHGIDLLNVAGSTTDLYHSVWTGTCPTLTLVPNTCSDPNSSVVTGLTPGQTYYIRVYSWTATTGQTSTFDVCVKSFPPAPGNDNCANSEPLTVEPYQASGCPNATYGTTASATKSTPNAACTTTDNDDDVWYYFTATQTTHIARLCNIALAYGTMPSSMGVEVFNGSCGGTASNCSNAVTISTGTASATLSGLTVGTTYYLRVWAAGTAGRVNFDISIMEPPVMTFVSCTVGSQITTSVGAGTVNANIVRLDIVVNGISNPLSAFRFGCSTNGSTSPVTNNISTAKLYYTGTSTTFTTTTLVGSADILGDGAFTIMPSQVLTGGLSNTTNYFWLAYDVKCGATTAHLLDGEVNGVFVGGAPQVPTVQAPAGSRSIIALNSYDTKADGNWNDAATWACGVPPAGTTSAININHNVTLNTDYSFDANLTVASGKTLTINSNTLTMGPNNGYNRLMTVNGTLSMGGGTLNINGSITFASTSSWNMSMGTINIDPNSGVVGTSSTSSNPALNILTGALNVTGGTINIKDPMFPSATRSIAYSHGSLDAVIGTGCTINIGTNTGGSHSNTSSTGFYLECNVSTGTLELGTVNVNGGLYAATNSRHASTNTSSIYITKIRNLTVNAGAEFVVNSAVLAITGDLVNNGVMTVTSTTVDRGLAFAGDAQYVSGVTLYNGSNAQSLSGSGFFRKATADAVPGSQSGNLCSAFSVWQNAGGAGVTLNMPLTVTSALRLNGGKTITSTANFLALGTSGTLLGTLYTNSTTAPTNIQTTNVGGWVNGPFKRWFSGTTTDASQQGILPVGSTTAPQYAQVVFTATPGTGTLTSFFTEGAPGDTGLPLTDTGTDPYCNPGAVSPTGFVTINPGDGLGAGTYTSRFNVTNYTGITNLATARVLKRPTGGGAWTLDGTYVAGVNNLISRTGMTGFSEFAAIQGSNIALPIELLTFKGYADKNVNVLEWTTASEINTDKFIVERSIDSKKWEDVAEVESAGDSRITSSYKAIDDQPYSKAYYRLKSIDRDGRFQVSESIFIERNDRTFKLYSVSPNPNRGDFTVTFNAASDGESRLILVNSLGMRVHSQNVNSKAGTNAEYLNATNLTNGIYTLLIEQDGQIITQRVVINK